MTGQPRKARARKHPPDPGRWNPCARCAQCYPAAARWPEGPICRYCLGAAQRREGTCVTCGHHGMVPGLTASGEPTCLRCSGIPLNLTCHSCGEETVLGGVNCWRCVLGSMVRDLLAGPDGNVPAELEPLAAAICSMRRPNSGVTWLRGNPRVGELLRSLAAGTVELSHQGLDELPSGKTVEYLRALLVQNEILPPRDRRIAMFERWLTGKLDTVDDVDHRQVVDRFARWYHLRRMRTKAPDGPVPVGTYARAKQSITVAIEFLAWLQERNTSLSDCAQSDVDSWLATGTSTRHQAKQFLYWCQFHRLTGKLELPQSARPGTTVVGESERLRIVRSLLLHDELQLHLRVAGCLIALFGQPVARVVNLRLDAVEVSGDAVRIRLSREWLDVPEPFATLLAAHLAARGNLNTAANVSSPWLFPGIMPGEQLSQIRVVDALAAAGVLIRAIKNTAWRQLVREAPPAVLAEALGISAATAMRHAELAGVDWARYASLRSFTTPTSSDSARRPDM